MSSLWECAESRGDPPGETQKFRISSIDRIWRALARRIAARPGPITEGLSEVRSQALGRILDKYRSGTAALAPRLAAGDTTARQALADLAERALAEFRSEVRAAARRSGASIRAMATVDRLWAKADARELMDDPELDPLTRSQILAALDHFNRGLGSYEIFLDLIRPLLRPDGATRIFDLASGHGGFALAAARRAREEGFGLDITASDLRREYLDLGARAARHEGLEVNFRVLDAGELAQLTGEGLDVVTCTQSLHHLRPGLIAIIFEAAVRTAARGVLFVDGCRSLRTSLGLGLFNALRYHHRGFVHDTVISARRFFVPQELELLARLGPWGDGVEASWQAPGFCVLRSRHGCDSRS